VAVIAAVFMFIGLRPRIEAKPIDSIAVVPFINESRDETVEYLSDGFTDSLISSLSRLPGLKVISHNSVARYKGQVIDPTVVGSELKVGAILSGKFTRVGDDLHIVVELVDTRDRSFLWGKQYDKKASEVLSVQEDIAQQTAEKLSKKLDAESKQSLLKDTPHDPRAYDLYVKGRWYWNKRSGDGLKQALQYYQQAIDLDPTYALPYAGLADAYVINAGWAPPRESYLRANAAAHRALELNSGLGEAHATLGFIKAHYERDWPAAQDEFKRAIELNPNHATAHHWYGDYFLARGEFAEALQEFERARELDPLSPIINTDIGLVYFHKRQYDLAIKHFKTVADLFPDFFPVHHHLAWAYMQKEMYKESIDEFQKALSISKGHTMVKAMLGYAYAVSGKKDEARKILKELQDYSARQYVPPYRFAVLYTGLGEKDLAFEWLNKSYDDLDILLIYVNVSPFFDSLRQDPRFDQLLKRLRLTSPSAAPATTRN
jgi:TolB-like protein/Flp pilus assembly protein TadD